MDGVADLTCQWSLYCSEDGYSCSDEEIEDMIRQDALVGQRLLEEVGKRKRDPGPDDYVSEDAQAWDDYGPIDLAPFTQEQ